MSRRIASFLTLSILKTEEVSRFFRFQRCQVQKFRKSGRLAAFLMLSPSNMGEALQNCFVFKLASSKMEEALQNSFVVKPVGTQTDR